MNYQRLFAKHDHPTQWEYPPDFDYNSATARFAEFVVALSTILGSELQSETGSRIQDASFHSQVFLPIPDGQHALVRFSNFGDMVTVGTVSDDKLVPESILELVTQLLPKHGYTYV